MIMKKFLPFTKRQPSLDRYTFTKNDWSTGSERFSTKSLRRISATSLNTKSIQVVRGAYNIDLNKVDSSFTKLHKACLLNDETQVRKQIHKVNNNAHDSSKRYPIHLAVVNGNFTIVKLLIENQANPNAQDNEGNTPLIKSIECGHEHLVKYLLNNGANPNIPDLDNNSALHWAMTTESVIAIDALLSSKKCDLTLCNNKEENVLHLAVRSPLISASVYELLLRGGLDINAADQLGLTAFDIAQACNNKIAVTVLTNFIKNLTSNSINNSTINQDDVDNDVEKFQICDSNQSVSHQQQPTKICEEYKQQYITKSHENLEYEKRLIQLTAQIERLKLDMSFLREQNEKLESDYGRLLAENTILRQDNTALLEQLRKNKHKSATTSTTNNTTMNNDDFEIKDFNENHSNFKNNQEISFDKIGLIDCKGHEEFIKTKTALQERINKLRFGLTKK